MSTRRFLPSWIGKQFSSPSRFQILSDLHLEVGQQYSDFQIPVKAPNLILAGDIGCLIDYDNYLEFLTIQTSLFERIFLVLGNHEFHDMAFDDAIARARELEKEPSLNGKLVLLHQVRWDDPTSDATVLGCTLWSSIPPESAGITSSKVKDFKKITGWTVDAHNARYASDSAWLKQQLLSLKAEGKERTVLVVTHHAPCMEGTSRPKDSSNPWSVAFATDIFTTQQWHECGIDCWVFGHTHYTTELVKEGVRVVSNQRGYVAPSSMPTSKTRWKSPGPHEFDVERVIEL
jgi:predicted phosphodiesterase